MNQLLLVGLGGFLGAISRFMVSKYTTTTFGIFPIGTLIVNVTGSFILALISYLVLEGRNISPDVRNFATIGFIGAYTTMSTFSFETMRFLDQGEYSYFALNVILNIVLCFSAIALGRYCALLLTK
ncbi:MAG TPA: fluoride efflux transporter CrcB [Candidatus Saccharimonadales bacterium]|nr:fluoride efflux transporter CrcB [Candidatus Saccharimonadales bacterium]